MEVPAQTVVICEENETRADLYVLWLDDIETEKALTSRELADVIGDDIAVVIIDQSFSDSDTETVLDFVDNRAPQCRTVGTRSRSDAFPKSGFDQNLIRPVFEEDLTECVKDLYCQSNYERVLKQYYQTTISISSYEWQADDEYVDDEHGRLENRMVRLRRLLDELRAHMSDEDVRAVIRDISVGDIEGLEDAESIGSKYRPSQCSECGQDWNEPIDGSEPTVRLGAFVWRCVNCGAVEARSDPRHQQIGSYRS